MPIQKVFVKAFIKAISALPFGDIVDLKILQPDWLTTFRPIPQESDIFQIWDLCKNTENDINFHYRTNSVKTNSHIHQ